MSKKYILSMAGLILCLAAAAHAQRAPVSSKDLASRLVAQGVDSLVFAERLPGRDSHYYANFGYSCCDPNRWLHGADGGRLCRLDLRSGEVKILLDDPGGAVRDPQVHYDGGKVLFSYRKGPGHHYNLYEIDIDGSNLRQLTDGLWDDVEPTYLPDGGIVFCSTRCKRYIGCWFAPSATLHRCDANGLNTRMISSGSFTENTPAVLPDGRILYTRWEYVNRDPVSFHHLWTINPDGTRQMVYYGNARPGGVFIDAQPIAGTSMIACINSPHHGSREHAGAIALLDPQAGPDEERAMRTITSASDYRDPWPISPSLLLAARGSHIVAVDELGEVGVVHTGKMMVHEPRSVMRRRREQIIPPASDLSASSATLILADVYSGRGMEGVKRGSIKKLLIMEDLPKPVNYHGGGSQPIGHGVTSTLKRILGTVPVEPDGSACFEVPAMRSIYFAALDAQDRSIKQMRSFVTLGPGETAGCVGCHEQRTQTHRQDGRQQPLSLRRRPSRIDSIAVPAVMDFPRDIQPLLDRHCISCHKPGLRDGGVTLTGDRGPVYSLSYYELLLNWQIKDTKGSPRDGSGRQDGGDPAYQTYSFASALMSKIDGTHHAVKLSPKEQQLVRLWIDSGAQYPGTYAALGTGQIGGCWKDNLHTRVMADKWPSTAAAVEAVQRRCGQCHSAKQLPQHVTARIPLDLWGDMLSWTRPLSRYSRHRIYNLTRPEKSLILMQPLAKQAGGYADRLLTADSPKPGQEDRTRPPRPVGHHPVIFRDGNDPDYKLILSHVQAASAKLHEIKRFDMPGFQPDEHYLREMKRYGVLPAGAGQTGVAIDVYATDEAYWRLFWHQQNRQ